MGCASEEEKQRIIGLRIWKFGSFFIAADDWIPEAGRSNVLAKLRTCWIQVFGIPLHLRSNDLFRSIGNFCGAFVEADITNWFKDGIRIKIYVKEDIPDEVVLQYQNNVFPVMVMVEPSPAVAFVCEEGKFPDSNKHFNGPYGRKTFASSKMVTLSSRDVAAESDNIEGAQLITSSLKKNGLPYQILIDLSLTIHDKACETASFPTLKDLIDLHPELHMDLSTKQGQSYSLGPPQSDSYGPKIGDVLVDGVEILKTNFISEKVASTEIDFHPKGINLCVDLTAASSSSSHLLIQETSQRNPDGDVEPMDSSSTDLSDTEGYSSNEEVDDYLDIDSDQPNLQQNDFITALEKDISCSAMEFGSLIGLKINDSEVEGLCMLEKSVKEAFTERAPKPKLSKLSRELVRLNWEASTDINRSGKRCAHARGSK
ncbi:hypothetical protein LINGRAHAP2_LOCUS23127 [Linum grandiflorum]